MLKRVLKLIIGVLLIPSCFGASLALYYQLLSLQTIGRPGWFFLAGTVTYGILYACAIKLNVLYVFGHEAVHALLAVLCGGKVKSFRASRQGGGVATDKVNVMISLGPYVVPFYTLVAAGLFRGIRFFLPAAERYAGLFIYLLGASTAFHLLMTIDSLRVEQPDLTEHGYIFSLVIMYGLNAGVLSLLISVVFADNGFARFAQDAVAQSGQMYCWIFAKISARP